jgi:hypothetical protein
MRKEKQLVFNGAMMYIHRRYIVPSGILRSKPYSIINNSINGAMSNNNNAYDVDMLYNIYNYIKELANCYDKIATIPAFKALTGITKMTLYDWRSSDILNSSDTYREKKRFVDWLTASEEDELKEFNLRNALGATERLNVDHGRREVKGVVSVTGGAELSAAILPKLSENRAQLAITEQAQG